jgi:hypothetical protein
MKTSQPSCEESAVFAVTSFSGRLMPRFGMGDTIGCYKTRTTTPTGKLRPREALINSTLSFRAQQHCPAWRAMSRSRETRCTRHRGLIRDPLRYRWQDRTLGLRRPQSFLIFLVWNCRHIGNDGSQRGDPLVRPSSSIIGLYNFLHSISVTNHEQLLNNGCRSLVFGQKPGKMNVPSVDPSTIDLLGDFP